jgi:hypothetical protein
MQVVVQEDGAPVSQCDSYFEGDSHGFSMLGCYIICSEILVEVN